MIKTMTFKYDLRQKKREKDVTKFIKSVKVRNVATSIVHDCLYVNVHYEENEKRCFDES